MRDFLEYENRMPVFANLLTGTTGNITANNYQCIL
jgi:hypothetical protein